MGEDGLGEEFNLLSKPGFLISINNFPGVGITWNETVCPYRPLARISSNCHSLLTSLHEHNANSNRGDLILDLFNLGLSTPGMPNMFILHVDKYFALVYYCVNGINNVKAEHSWVLSRLQFPNTRKLEVSY